MAEDAGTRDAERGLRSDRQCKITTREKCPTLSPLSIEAKCLLIASQPAMGELQRQLGAGVDQMLWGDT